jgi:uncharacterized membrane protein
MGTFLESLHIFAALLVIGPLLWAPITARRAIGRREAVGVRAEARKLVRFGAGSVVVAVLGALTLLAYRSYNFASPWVVISITLYVVTLGVLNFLTLPAMRKAARLIDAGGPLVRPTPVAGPSRRHRATAATTCSPRRGSAPSPAGSASPAYCCSCSSRRSPYSWWCDHPGREVATSPETGALNAGRKWQ